MGSIHSVLCFQHFVLPQMYKQALVGPAFCGVHFEFTHLTSDSMAFQALFCHTQIRRPKLPVMVFVPNSSERSHHMLSGGWVVGAAVGAGAASPFLVASLHTHTCVWYVFVCNN